MADILIKDVKIWERCADCPMAGWDQTDHCLITGRDIFPYAVEGKPSDCPLVELPEHGDLIDRDALFKQMGVTDMDCYKCEFGNHGFCGRGEFSAACEAIEDAPVIVPSNKEEIE